MRTDIETIQNAADALNTAIGGDATGYYERVSIVDTPEGPVDVNAVHRALGLLHVIAERSATTTRDKASRTVFKATLGGRPIGETRYRAIVQEMDRVKFYSLMLIVPEDMTTHAEPITSGSGVHYGVRIHTTGGTLELTTAPGLKPRRKRSR